MTYSEYKDSGIDWIGEIPAGWEMIKLKFLCNVIIGLTYSPENIVDENSGTLVMRSSNVQEGKPSFLDNVFVEPHIIPEKLITREGDILVCSRNGSRKLIGKNCIISKEIEGMTFGAFMTILRTPNWKFIYWVLNSPIFKSQSGLYLTSTINQLKVSTIKNFVIPFVHDDNEQQEIVDYLDHKTQQIDSFIEKTNEKIAILKEQRNAIINQVVTKGLDPDAEMKDSEVKWIGEIPVGWEVYPIGGLGTFTKGKGVSKDEIKTSGFPCIRYAEIYTTYERIVYSTVSYIEEDSKLNSRQIYKGDVLFTGSGEEFDEIGKTVVYYGDDVAFAGGDIIILKLNVEINPLYVSYTLNSHYVMSKKSRLGKSSTGVVHTYAKDLKTIKFPCPPLQEQQSIVEYLDHKTQQIDSQVERELQRIELLKEYRNSLISEVVTGQVDVRGELVA